MIIVGVFGGLGNQLQQYAMYKKFVSMGVHSRVDISWFEDDVQEGVATKRQFLLNRLHGVNFEICTEDEKRHLVEGDGFARISRMLGFGKTKLYSENSIFDSKVLQLTDMYLEGYWGCDCYYADILPELRKEIRFPIESYCNWDKLDYAVQDIGRHRSISLHIRRGDYLDEINKPIYENICTDSYYLQALDCCLDDDSKAKLYVFSDDPVYADEYVSRLIGRYGRPLTYEVVDFNCGLDSMFDIYLMSLCDCNITANSTFSYWGARLNSKKNAVKIRPSKHKNSQYFSPADMKRLWPEWILVSPEGKAYGF